jgi:hypothetical protein
MATKPTKTDSKAKPVEGEIMDDTASEAAGAIISADQADGASLALTDDDFFGEPTGMEDVDNEDVTIPRWTILQGQSPQVNSRKDEYIEGAKMGMIFNTATGKVVESQNLIMAAYQRRYIEWTPRDKPCPIENFPQVTGGGLYRDYGTDDSILAECTKFEDNASLWTPRGNELVVTGTWYVLDPDTMSLGFIAMGKTQFTSSKKLMAGIRDEKLQTSRGIRPAPLYYRAWELGTRLREFEGNEWFVWNHKPAFRLQEHVNGRDILALVREINETIARDEVTIDVAVGETDGDRGGSSQRGDDAAM